MKENMQSEVLGEKVPVKESDIQAAEASLEKLEVASAASEEPMDFEGELATITAKETAATESLTQKTAAYDEWKQKMDALRNDLGLPAKNESYPAQQSIDDVKAAIEKLKEEKIAAEEGEDMNDILAMIGNFSQAEINIIMQTGKTSDGKEVAGKDGKKVKPNILMKLLAKAYTGAKVLTKSGFKELMSSIEGIANGIYEGGKNRS